MSNIYIGLDISLNHSGVAVLKDEDASFYKVDSSSGKNNFEKMLTAAEVISRFVDTQITKSRDWTSIYVCSERPLFRWKRSDNLVQLGGVYYMVMCRLYTTLMSQGVDDRLIQMQLSNTNIKKIATGSGKASKNDMLSAVPDNIKQQINQMRDSDGDLPDAYWCAIVGKRKVENES